MISTIARRFIEDKIGRPLEPSISANHVNKHYSHEKGWDGKEGMPWTVAEAWDRYGFVDFRGHDVSDPAELAAMWSIYTNPFIEYSHIVLIKNNQIVHQMLMTSGVSAFAISIPAAGMQSLKKRLQNIDYDSMYILHNHPDADDRISDADSDTCNKYRKAFGDKFKGSIILEKTKWHLLEYANKKRGSSENKYDTKKVHSILPISFLSDEKISFNDKLLKWIKSHEEISICRDIVQGHASSMAIAFLDTNHHLLELMPYDFSEYSRREISNLMITHKAADCILITNNQNTYENVKSLIKKNGKEPIFNLSLISPEGYTSLRDERIKIDTRNPKQFITTREMDNYVINKGRYMIADSGVLTMDEVLKRNKTKQKRRRKDATESLER